MSDHNIEWISQVDPEFVKMILGIWDIKVNAKIISIFENVPIKVITWEFVDGKVYWHKVKHGVWRGSINVWEMALKDIY